MIHDKLKISIAALVLSLCASCDNADSADDVGDACTHDVCSLDGSSLRKCNHDTGAFDDVPCPYGCANDACNEKPAPDPNPDDACSHDVCSLDGSSLKKCNHDTGAFDDIPCPYGCANDACNEKPAPDPNPDDACSHDVCSLDGSSLKKCNYDTGAFDDVPCPYGCANDACNEKPAPDPNPDGACSHDVCSLDGSSLRKCDPDTGAFDDVPCPYGCANDACNVPNNVPCAGDICMATDELGVCDKTTGKYAIQKCPHGCQNSACIEMTQTPTYHIGDPCDASEFSEFCDGDNAVVCDANGSVSAMLCDQSSGFKCAALPNFYGKSINRASCFRDKDKCLGGERRTLCVDYVNSSISGNQRCYKSTDGESYFDWDLGAAALCRNAENLPTSCENANQCGNTPIVETCSTLRPKCDPSLGYGGCAHFADLGAACYTHACAPSTMTSRACDSYTRGAQTLYTSQQCVESTDGNFYRIDIVQCAAGCDAATGLCLN